MARHLHALLVAVLLLLQPLAAQASDHLDISALLAERGTRLLVVEFYATWCKPCMAAMPLWQQLKKDYAAQGLRIAVVNTRDPDGMASGRCSALPFSPDAKLCDLEGTIEQGFGVGGALPAAFLWSWQGNLLVQKGHVAEIKREIERYLQGAPRVVVERGAGVPAGVELAVKESLGREGKITVVADAQAQQVLDAARQQQERASARYDEKLRCEAGKELPANAVLRLQRVAEGKVAYLNLGLYDLQTGCQLATSHADWTPAAAVMADEVVGKLMRQLRRDRVQMPGAASQSTQMELSVASSETQTSATTLKEAVAEYTSAMRWGFLERASAYVAEVNRKDWLRQRRLALSEVQIHDYEIRAIEHDIGTDRARVVVVVAWSRPNDVAVRQALLMQNWQRTEGVWALKGQVDVHAQSPSDAF